MDIRENMLKEYLALKPELIESIKEIVAIPSVLDEEAKDTPFGKEIDRCLDKTLELCEKLGFKIYKDPKGYYGYAEMGEGDEMIGILGHLDVVPAGDIEKWNSDP
ncbi:MAG: Xaa-His dipeptidase, partial [Fusobacteriaceae bacterium]